MKGLLAGALLLALGCTTININELTGASSTDGSSALVDQVVVSPSFVETLNGQRFIFTAQAFAGSLPVAGARIFWSSSNPSVANILSSTGELANVKAESPGEAEIAARVGRAEGRARVLVRAAN